MRRAARDGRPYVQSRRCSRAAPALLLLLFAAWSGSFASGAGAAAAAGGHCALLLAALAAGGAWRDPLRLGSAGRLLPAALWITLAASAWASPTPRAGRVAVALLPAFLLLPAAVERWWRDAAARRRGLRAVSAVVGAVAGWSLLHLALSRAPRAAMPLGHHNLLAGWLVAVLPLAVLPWRDGGPLAVAGGGQRDALAGRAGGERLAPGLRRPGPRGAAGPPLAAAAGTAGCCRPLSSSSPSRCRGSRRSSPATTRRRAPAPSISTRDGRAGARGPGSAGARARCRGRSASSCGPSPGSARRARWWATCTPCRSRSSTSWASPVFSSPWPPRRSSCAAGWASARRARIRTSSPRA